MADWSSVEFASASPKSRKAQDFLPILVDVMACWDFIACAVSGQAALALYARYVLGKSLDASASGPFWRDIAFGSLIAALVLREPLAALTRHIGSPLRLVLAAARRCAMACAVLIVVGVATRATDDLARLWLVTWMALFACIVAGTRAACGCYLARLQGQGALHESVAIVGAPGTRNRLAARIGLDARIVGTFGDRSHGELDQDGEDDLDDLIELGRDGEVDSVILAVDPARQVDFLHIIERLKSLPIQVAVCTEGGWTPSAAPQMRMLGGLPMAVVADRPIRQWNILLKALLDKLGALALLALLSPLMLAIGIAVGLTSPGPIIFRQRRQGWCGREFTVFKFRTMFEAPPGRHAQFQTRRGDARCTPVGRLLRKTSLDELPQLWNVLRGDMSLVGPRPHAESLHEMDRAGREVVAEYAQRHRVKPGITGWAQVHGARGATATLDELRHRVEFDLFYIENWSIWLDLKILLRTPFVITGENAF